MHVTLRSPTAPLPLLFSPQKDSLPLVVEVSTVIYIFKVGVDKRDLPQVRVSASLSKSWTRITWGATVSFRLGPEAVLPSLQAPWTKSVTTWRAAQSSRLYSMSFVFHKSSRVRSHRILQAIL